MYFDILRYGKTYYSTWDLARVYNVLYIACLLYDDLSLSHTHTHTHTQLAPARYIMCDMLQGSVERIIYSNPLLRALQRLKLVRYIVWKRQTSYSVQIQVI